MTSLAGASVEVRCCLIDDKQAPGLAKEAYPRFVDAPTEMHDAALAEYVSRCRM